MKESDRPIIWWDCSGDSEILTYRTQNQAIESYLDTIDFADHEKVIKVYGYAHMIVPKIDVNLMLEHILEREWEEYIGEDSPDITDRMGEAAQQFVDVLHKEFKPWACEQVTEEEVNVKTWITENRPDWLKLLRVIERLRESAK